MDQIPRLNCERIGDIELSSPLAPESFPCPLKKLDGQEVYCGSHIAKPNALCRPYRFAQTSSSQVESPLSLYQMAECSMSAFRFQKHHRNLNRVR